VDELKLATLRDELLADCRVAHQAWQTAQARLREGTPAALEGCGHHLARLYNAIEQMGTRLARAFENQIEDERSWHAELIRRLSMPIQGVRPAFFPEDLRQPLRELRAFRHVFTHAYDLQLDPEKLALLIKYSGQVVPQLEGFCRSFVHQVAQQEGLIGF
jgi:hypothetical protein